MAPFTFASSWKCTQPAAAHSPRPFTHHPSTIEANHCVGKVCVNSHSRGNSQRHVRHCSHQEAGHEACSCCGSDDAPAHLLLQHSNQNPYIMHEKQLFFNAHPFTIPKKSSHVTDFTHRSRRSKYGAAVVVGVAL